MRLATISFVAAISAVAAAQPAKQVPTKPLPTKPVPATKAKEPSPEELLLAKIDATYKAPKQLSASFEQTTVDPTFGTTTHKTGTLQASKPDQFRLDYVSKSKAHAGNRFVFDGKSLWFIDSKNTKIYRYATQSSELPAMFAFFRGASSLATQFGIAITTAKPYAVAGSTVLALTPKQPSAAYSALYLVVDPATGQVTRTTVINSSGLVSTYTFSKLDLTSAIPAAVFQFDPASLPDFKVESVATPK